MGDTWAAWVDTWEGLEDMVAPEAALVGALAVIAVMGAILAGDDLVAASAVSTGASTTGVFTTARTIGVADRATGVTAA